MVNEKLEETDDWEGVKDHIITLDRAEALSKNYLNNPRGRRQETGANVQPKKAQCMACGRRGHAHAECRVEKEKLQCTFCKSKGSHMTKVCQKKAKEKKKTPTETTPKTKTVTKSKSPPNRKRDRTPVKTRDASEDGGDTSNVVQQLLAEEHSDSDKEPDPCKP